VCNSTFQGRSQRSSSLQAWLRKINWNFLKES
jgi:hypothetical protein